MLRRALEEVFGLVVEDGAIAVGAIGAIVATGLIGWLAGSNADIRNLSGPLLMIMIVGLLVTNLRAAGRSAAKRR